MFNEPLFLKLPRKYGIFLVLVLSFSLAGFSQVSRQIAGRISDEKNEPLANVSVILKGTKEGTTTDSKGGYSIKIPDAGNTILVFSFIGYENQEISVGKENRINRCCCDRIWHTIKSDPNDFNI
jgi:hypothetical protein